MWIVRNKRGELFVYQRKPKRRSDSWISEHEDDKIDDFRKRILRFELFSEVTWDTEPRWKRFIKPAMYAYKRARVGDKIKIIYMNDDNGQDPQVSAYNGREGFIELIDDTGNLHGTWGGLAVIPSLDEFEICG